jgi:hypothetical protein
MTAAPVAVREKTLAPSLDVAVLRQALRTQGVFLDNSDAPRHEAVKAG